MNRYTCKYILLAICLASLVACSEDENLTPDYGAPDNLPASLEPGSPLNDAILGLYGDLGIVVYTDTSLMRFNQDLVSNGPSDLVSIIPADTAASIFYLTMIRQELYDLLPDDKKFLTPRNFYFLKSPVLTGTGYYKYGYKSYLWQNSYADLTVGLLNDTELDTTFLKESLIYGLSGILRGQSSSIPYFSDFMVAADEGGFYWSVSDLQSGLENGFVTGTQAYVMSDAMDFDTYASWGATVDPAERDSLFSLYPVIATKYNLVSGMFRTAGIPLEEINSAWQTSPLNPKNN